MKLDEPPELSSESGSAATNVTSPIEAMRLEEMERSRIFFRVVVALTISGIVVALTSTGDPIAKIVVVVSSVASLLGATYILTVVLKPTKYDQKLILVPGLPVLIGAIAGIYYWGTVSPVSGMLVFGIYFFSLGADSRMTTMMYIVTSVSHALLALGITAGLLEDRGLIKMTHLKVMDQLSILGIIECLYLVAFVTARLSQRTTLRAVSILERAVRGAAHREALLVEARAELDRVREIGGPGKFSEQMIGSYKLGALIGRGAWGEVYQAHHTSITRDAAVKLLRADSQQDPSFLERFRREAEATAKIDSPNVVRVFDVGTTAGSVPFIVMERLRGHDLAHEMRAQRRIPLAEAKVIVDQIAAGLEAAREHGIVHRDLKPSNVFCTDDNPATRVWKILDFGVSKVGDSNTLTAGQVIGTPAYMAPEQARAEDVDHRADVYALAAILYRAVTGYPAFATKDIATTLFHVTGRVPPRPSKLTALPADVDRVLALGLAKDPALRFQTATELAAWFTAAIDSNLDAAQRQRADEQIARAPWGSTVAAVAPSG